MNFVSRLFAASALIVVEYTTQPIVFVFTIGVIVYFLSNGLIREPRSKNVDFLSNDDHTFSESVSNFNASDNYSR
jgi:hypothetical protein